MLQFTATEANYLKVGITIKRQEKIFLRSTETVKWVKPTHETKSNPTVNFDPRGGGGGGGVTSLFIQTQS